MENLFSYLYRVDVLFFLLLNFIGTIGFLVNLQKTMKEINAEHQKIAPRKVWRLLIPIYNLFFQFYLVRKVAHSLYYEYAAHNWNTKPVIATYHLGIMMGVLFIFMLLPFTGIYTWLCFTSVFFLYWIGIFSMRRQLILMKNTIEP